MLEANSHPKHEEALPTSRPSSQLKFKPPLGRERAGVRGGLGQGVNERLLQMTYSALLCQFGSPASCSRSLAEKQRSRGGQHMFWTGSMESEP